MNRLTHLTAPRSIRPETSWDRPARGFALCFAGLATAGIIAAVFVYRAEVQTRLRNLAQKEQTQVTLVSAAVARDLAIAAGSLLVVARSNELRDVLASGSPATHDALANTLVSYASLTRLFDQVRYIDETGWEIVRVSYDGGRAAVAAHGLLADQSQRAYVAQTLRLAPGEFYLSPIDLALRSDAGERAPKAVIRLATPVVDPQGRRRGVVVLDYLARRLVENVVQPAPAAGSMMLLNRDGDWVSGSDSEAASTFRGPADRSFADTFPDAWGRIAPGVSGQFETAEGLFTFDTVSPLRDLSALAGGIGAGATAGAPSGAALKVVAHVPPSVLAEHRQLARSRLGTLLPPALFVAALLAGLLARYVMRYRDTLVALRRARGAASAASRAKSAFLTLMNREIRAPIQGVLGMTELALVTDGGPQQREYLQTARASAASLLTVVDSMLEFSRIEAGSVTIQAIPFSLREAIGETTRMLTVHARTNGLTLGCDIAPDLPDALIGDPGRLRQVIGILAENAIKFTARGEIRIAVARFVPRVARAKRTPRIERSDGPIGLQFTVRDTGIGIAPAKLEAVFGAFAQGDDATGRYGGTGLGLPIARRLAEMMGGTMWADSVPGKGSTFTFTARFGRGVEVPVAQLVDPPVATAPDRADAPAAPSVDPPLAAAPDLPAPASVERRLHVLLAEDDAVEQALVRHILESRGHSVVTVADGHSALAALELAREPFDVVLMDVDLPHLDGLAAVRAIRRREAERTTDCSTRLPVLAMSAGASEEDDARSASAGADRCVAKPIDVDALCAALAALAPELPPISVVPPAASNPERIAPSTVEAGR